MKKWVIYYNILEDGETIDAEKEWVSSPTKPSQEEAKRLLKTWLDIEITFIAPLK